MANIFLVTFSIHFLIYPCILIHISIKFANQCQTHDISALIWVLGWYIYASTGLTYFILEAPSCSGLNHCALQLRHNERDGVSNHQGLDCLLTRLLRRRSKKTPKLRVIGLCEGNSPETDGFPSKWASNAENASISWRHHVLLCLGQRRLWGSPDQQKVLHDARRRCLTGPH